MTAKYKEKKTVVQEEKELTSENTSHTNYSNEKELTSTYTSHKYSNEKELLKEGSYKNQESLEKKQQTLETSSKGKRVFLKKVETIFLFLK